MTQAKARPARRSTSTSKKLNIAAEVAKLERMTPRELRDKYAEVFDEESRSGNKRWLIKRIAWRLQANAEGDLSERARQRALELADDSDLRVRPPAQPKLRPANEIPAARELPNDGTELTRQYKGRLVRVRVLDDGFQYEGEHYRTLSAVALAVTGSHTSGPKFFGVAKKGGAK